MNVVVLAVMILIPMTIPSHLKAEETQKLPLHSLTEEQLPAPILSESLSQEPSKPIAKTIIGSVLTGSALFLSGLGATSMILTEKRNDPHGLAWVFGEILVIGGGCALIPGGILLGSSIHDWRIYKKREIHASGEQSVLFGAEVSFAIPAKRETF